MVKNEKKIIKENVENIEIRNENNSVDIKNTSKFSILGISIWRILAYFIIYSILGFIVETIFGLAKYGTLESRQSFVYGPFCAIYGIGAVIMIIALQFFQKNYNTLFLGGCIVGSVIEYIVSFIGEAILRVKWWDYSEVPLNINGRICLLYSVFWGILALYLMISLNPKIDKFLYWIKRKLNMNLLKNITIVFFILMMLDCVLTMFALSSYMIRMIVDNNIEVKNEESINNMYNFLYGDNNNIKGKIIYTFWGNEKMVKTFPRLKIEDKNGKIIYFSELVSDIEPYYYKLKNIRTPFN